MPTDKKILAFLGKIEIEAAASEGTPPQFKMVAYTGIPMILSGYSAPVIVELAGIEIPSQKLPVRLQHDAGQGVGHTIEIKVDDGKLIARGLISRDTEFAREVIAAGKNGFPWQTSIGARKTEGQGKRPDLARAGLSCLKISAERNIAC
jgi:hypothetical protein